MARTALLTLLGEYVMPRDGWVWQETLVAALVEVGYKVHAARQAVARSVNGGWLRTERNGRRSRVIPSESFADMMREAATRIYEFGRPQAWSGEWLLVVLKVPEEQRETRHVVRSQLAWAGFGSLGNGVWISPHVSRETELASVLSRAPAAELLTFRTVVGDSGQPPERVVADAWDLGTVATGYHEFTHTFSALRARTPRAQFGAHTRLVNEWRRFPYLDPDLPEQMLPPSWPRAAARDVFNRRYGQWSTAAHEYFQELEERVEGGMRAASVTAA